MKKIYAVLVSMFSITALSAQFTQLRIGEFKNVFVDLGTYTKSITDETGMYTYEIFAEPDWDFFEISLWYGKDCDTILFQRRFYVDGQTVSDFGIGKLVISERNKKGVIRKISSRKTLRTLLKIFYTNQIVALPEKGVLFYRQNKKSMVRYFP